MKCDLPVMASRHTAISSCSRADFAQLACRGFASISKDSVSLEDKVSSPSAVPSPFLPVYYQRQCPVFPSSTFESSISSSIDQEAQSFEPIYQFSSAPSSCFVFKASHVDHQHPQRLRGSATSEQLFECRYRSSSPSQFSPSLDARAPLTGLLEPASMRSKSTSSVLQKTLQTNAFRSLPASAATRSQIDRGSIPSPVRVAAIFDTTHTCSASFHTQSDSPNVVSTGVAWENSAPTPDAQEPFPNLLVTPSADGRCKHFLQHLLVVSLENEEPSQTPQPLCVVPSSVSPTLAPSSLAENQGSATPHGFQDPALLGTRKASVSQWDQAISEGNRGRKPPRVTVPELRLTPACRSPADSRKPTGNETYPHQPCSMFRAVSPSITRGSPEGSSPRLFTDDATRTPVSARSESKAQWTEVSMGTWRRHDSPSPPAPSGHSLNFGSPSTTQRSARGSGTDVASLSSPETPSTERASAQGPSFLDPRGKRPSSKSPRLLRPYCVPDSDKTTLRDAHPPALPEKLSTGRPSPLPEAQLPALDTNAAGSEVTGRFVQQRLQARRAFGRAATILHQHLAAHDVAVLRAASPFGDGHATAGSKKKTETQSVNEDTLKLGACTSLPSLPQQHSAAMKASEIVKDLPRQRCMTGVPTSALASQASWAAAYAAATTGRALSPADLKQRKEKYLMQATASQAEALALLPAILHQHKLRNAQRRATGQFSLAPTVLLAASDATDVAVVNAQSTNV